MILGSAQFFESITRKTLGSRRVRRRGGFCEGVSDLQGFPPWLFKKMPNCTFSSYALDSFWAAWLPI